MPLPRLVCPTAVLLAILMTSTGSHAQPEGFNYDESQVPAYELPDPLTTLAGEPVTSATAWIGQRRDEILRLFEDHVYGRTPSTEIPMRFEVLEDQGSVFGGAATRKRVRVHLGAGDHSVAMDVLIYLPAAAEGPVPLFVGLNFFGNHAAVADPAVPINENWMRSSTSSGIVDHRATAASRGVNAHRWPVEEIVARGYGVATIYCGDLDPDYDDDFQNGIHPLFYGGSQTRPADNEWGTIGAWAWGLSRALDYFETDDAIDQDRVAVLGHSRLGKAALWAGANDERFALVISNNSGCGGAALARRRFGETVARINTSFPHWFSAAHQRYNDRENELPVDQHMLIALMAPRPVYIASATEDLWADPRGEFLAGKYAEPVYALFGKAGLGVDEPPAPDHSVGDSIGYHLRTGTHNILSYDWQRYMDFADRHFDR